MNSTIFTALPVIGFMFLALLVFSNAQGLAPSPSTAPEVPMSDGAAIDQGIAYILLVLALAITYLVH